MLEWLKRHAWKACIPLKGIGGSNPPLSAFPVKKRKLIMASFFCVYSQNHRNGFAWADM